MSDQPSAFTPRRLRVFLCHASEDKPTVRLLFKQLEDCNIDPWFDEKSLLAGQNWEEEISEIVQQVDVIIVCLSQNSISKAGFVQKEIKMALDAADRQPEGTIFLIPLRLEDCILPRRLKHLHAINYSTEDSFDKLIQALRYRGDSLQCVPIQNPSSLPLDRLQPRALLSLSRQVSPLAISQSGQVFLPRRKISKRNLLKIALGSVGVALTGGGVWLATLSPLFRSTPPSASSTPSLGKVLFTYRGHTSDIRDLAWAPNGKYVATASNDYTAQVWEPLTGKHIATCRHSDYVEGIAWSPDSTRIVTGSADGTAQIWKAMTGEHLYTYLGHVTTYQQNPSSQNQPWVNRVRWSPDGTQIASCDQFSASGHIATVQVWDAKNGKTFVIYRGHTNGVYAIAWSLSGSSIASAGYDGTLQIWQATTGNNIVTYRGRAYLFGLSWSPDSKYIAVGSSDAVVLLVNTASGTVLNTYNGHSAWVKDVVWSPNGKYIASGSDDGMIVLWNPATPTPLYTHNGYSGHINAVGWSPNSRLIASGGNTAQVWQAE